MDRKVDRHDTSVFVETNHLGPVDAAMRMVNLSLNIEHPGNTGCFHLVHICFNLRVGPNEEMLICDLLEVAAANEVRICLFDVTVHKEHLV